VAVAAAVEVSRPEAIATPAPQQRKALLSELSEDLRKADNDPRSEAHDQQTTQQISIRSH
jgi:hypothetical protein